MDGAGTTVMAGCLVEPVSNVGLRRSDSAGSGFAKPCSLSLGYLE